MCRCRACERDRPWRCLLSGSWRGSIRLEVDSCATAGLLRRFGLQLERRSVHAIAKAGRRRTVGEDMAEMCIAPGATHLGAAHEQGTVLVFADGVLGDRSVKARPAGAGIELSLGTEQWRAAAHATIDAGGF